MNLKKPTLVELCKAQGRRITGQRKLIAEVISSANDHPDVLELHRRAARKDERISLSTVYRTLKIFAEIGLIEQHSFEGGRFRVERATGSHHDHLIDTDSGKVIEFRSEEIERLQTEIALQLGFELTGHRLELYGRRIRGGSTA
jgi:Fur family transcriptional regulator, ferric uptake regulator